MKHFATGLAVVAAGVALALAPAGADDKGALPPDLAHVFGSAAAVVSVRPADLWDHELARGIRAKMGKEATAAAEGIAKQVGLPPAETERVSFVMLGLTPSGAEPVLFVAARKPYDKAKLLAAILPNGEEKTHAGNKYLGNGRHAVLLLDDKHYCKGTVDEIQAVLTVGKAKAGAPIYPALEAAARKHAVVVGVNPESLDKVSDEFPADAEPFKPLLKAKVGLLTIDAGSSIKAKVTAAFPDAEKAKAGAKALGISRKMAVGLLGQFEKNTGMVPGLAAVLPLVRDVAMELDNAKIGQDGAVVSAAVSMRLEAKTVGPVLGEALAKVRSAATRMQSQNNLKQIGLAMHNYHDVNNRFPAQAVFDKDGKALLSWRVLLLPYVEQDALYREFKLDEPWDSAHNKKLIAKMPKVYQVPEWKTKHEHGTFYQVFHGKGAIFDGKNGIRLLDITDGSSNTILVATAEKDVPWTKPEDIPFDDTKEVPKLGSQNEAGFNATFADGSVRFIKHTVDKDVLKALITRGGGEVIPNID